MTSDIRALISIISAQVDTIEAKYTKAGESYPFLNQPEPTFGALDHDPEVGKAKDIATAAAAQLLSSLRSPLDTVYEMACGTLQTAAMGFVEEVNIATILAEAEPEVRETYWYWPKGQFCSHLWDVGSSCQRDIQSVRHRCELYRYGLYAST